MLIYTKLIYTNSTEKRQPFVDKQSERDPRRPSGKWVPRVPQAPTTSLSLAHRLQVVRSKMSRSVTLEEVYDIKHATGHTDQHGIEFHFCFGFLIVLERWGGKLNVNLISSAEGGNDSQTNLLDTYLCKSCSPVSQVNKRRDHQDIWWHRQASRDFGAVGKKDLPLAPINLRLSVRRSGLSRGRLCICRR